MTRVLFGMLIVQLATTGTSQAQTAPELQVSIGGYAVGDDGGEKSSVFLYTGAIVVGKVTTGTFSVRDCAHFLVSGGASFRENAATGWRVEITPTKVVGQAVTFRLRWVRALDTGKALTAASEDVELTLRPGETRPMDSVPIPQGAKTSDGGPCRKNAAALRITVDNFPIEEFDRRLVAADMWLIERLPNGTERSQTQSLRGLPNRPIPFYFDAVVDGSASLDILGRIVARPESGALEVALQTRSRWGETSFLERNEERNTASRWLESVIHVKPEEIVEVGLPRLGDGAGTFANRVFSIRIRARRVR